MMRCPAWCGECYENLRGRANRSGHAGYRRPRVLTWESAMSVLRVRDTKPPAASGGAGGAPDGWSVRYPGLWEMLSSAVGPGGSPRRTSTLLVFCDDGLAKGCLSDRDQGLTAWASARGLEGLLDALEAGLQADSLEWRRPSSPAGRRKS